MTPSDKQRVIRNLVVEHPQFTDTVSALERFHYPVKGGLPARGTIAAVIGDSRTGKTFATKHYASRFSTSVGETGLIRPVVYVDMPPDGGGGMRGILEAFANSLGLQVTLRMTNPMLVSLVMKALVAQKAELLLLDEFDQVFRENDKRLSGAGRGLLRKIVDLNTLSIVCIGLPGAYDLLKADSQLVGRGGLPFQQLRPYAGQGSEEWPTFRLICDAFDRSLPFSIQAGLGKTDFAARLHWATKGNIGHLKFYIEAAAAEAINDETDKLELEHFAAAYDVRKPIGQTFNPFTHDLSLAPKPKPEPRKLKQGAAQTVFSKTTEPDAWAFGEGAA